jgi:uncharacterized protein YndB with AHSA1/START domain
MKATDPPVVVEQTFEAPIDKVWKALTEIDQMRQWYFENIPEFKAEVGFETQFVVSNEGRDFPHMWRITAVEPGRTIAYDWKFDGYPGNGLVVFELSQQGSVTTLTLTQTVRETFPDEIPEFRRENCIAGWDYFLKDRLKKFLEQPGQ